MEGIFGISGNSNDFANVVSGEGIRGKEGILGDGMEGNCGILGEVISGKGGITGEAICMRSRYSNV